MYQPTASFSDTFKILETCIRNVPCSSMDQGTNCPVRGRRAFRRVRKIAKSDYELRFVCPPVLYSECPLFEYGPGHKNCEKRLWASLCLVFGMSPVRVWTRAQKLWKATMSFVVSVRPSCIQNVPCSSMDQGTKIVKSDYELSCVCPSVCMEQWDSHWTDFLEILYLSSFRKSVEEIQLSLKFGKNDGYFT